MAVLGCLAGLGLAEAIRPSGAPFRLIIEPGLAAYRAGPSRLMLSSCPSWPTCSAYAKQAWADHGFYLGTLLAADRLIHEQGRLQEGPWVLAGGRLKVFDPLIANTFWWQERKEGR